MDTKTHTLLVGLTSIVALACVSTPVKAADPSVYIHGDDWLKDSSGNIPNGVPVCSQNAETKCDGQTPVGEPWQCVELAQRLYQAKGWDTMIIPNSGKFPVLCAAEIYTQAQNWGFKTYQNGLITDVRPGDMIVHSRADGGTSSDCSNGAGHVAIVDTIIGSTIYAKEQNWSSKGISIYDWDGTTISRTWPDSRPAAYIQGIVHSPLNIGNRMAVTQSDFDEWCTSGGADGAALVAPNAYSWGCYKNHQFTFQPAINMLSYCQSRYPGLNYVDILVDYNDPFSWRCFGPAGAQGGLDLVKYCKDEHFSGLSAPGKTVDNWSCLPSDGDSGHIYTYRTNNSATPSMTDACISQHNLTAGDGRARIENYNDPNSVECVGSDKKPPVPPAPSTPVTAQIDSTGASITVSWTVPWVNNSVQAAGFDISYSQTKADFALAPTDKCVGVSNHLFVRPDVCFQQLSQPVSNCVTSSDWGLNTNLNHILNSGKQICFKVSTYNMTGSSSCTGQSASTDLTSPACTTVP